MKKNKPFGELFLCSLKKTLKIMRNALILLFVGVLQANAIDTYSQKTRLSLNFTDTELTKVLDKIEVESQFFFLYNEKLLDTERKVNINVNDQLITVILDDLFKGTDVKYSIVDRKIILAPDYLTSESEQQVQKKITGTVTEKNGAPLPGVNVVVTGTSLGALTDVNGKYSLEVPQGSKSITFSFIGKKPQEVSIGTLTQINVVMAESEIGLEEVIVIGYGTVKKSDLTVSVATIASDKLEAFPTTNVLQAMQGKVAGLSITTNNGAPGSGSTIRIRGGSSVNASSSPLWVVDGFPGAPQPESEDIQSIQVLRDASAAAIYGSRGANGVILVTTKKGTSGDMKVQANVSYSIGQATKKYDLLDAHEYAKFVNDRNENLHPGSNPIFDPDTIGVGTNWQDVVLRKSALQMYQVSVTGGSDKVKVYSSVKYSNNKAIIISSFNEYLTGKLNLDAAVSDKTNVGMHLDFYHYNNNGVPSQTWFQGSGGVIQSALVFEPTVGIYKADGTYQRSINSSQGGGDNPYVNAVERKNQGTGDNLSSNMYLDFEIIKGLKLNTNLAIQFNSNRNGSYAPSFLKLNADGATASMYADRNINLSNYVYLTFEKTFADIHKLTVMAGHDYQSYVGESFSAAGKGFTNDAWTYWALGTATTALTPSSGTGSWKMEGIYGRLNYSLKEKYFFTFTAREDGSSRFGADNKWAFFPSAAVRWNIKKESFLEGIDAISDLSLHGGWGSNGNTDIGSYNSLATLNGNGIYEYVGGIKQAAVVPTSVANAKLSWETTTMTDAGADISIFNGKVNFSAEYYNKVTTGLLYTVPLPKYTGYDNMYQNIGKFSNEGVEFTLGTILSKGGFNWSSDFNISFNKTKVVTLPKGTDLIAGWSPFSGVSSWILREGEATNSFWGFVYEGVYQQGDDIPAGEAVGHAKYADINGRDTNGMLTGQPDGKIDGDDKTIIGNANPKFTFGWTNDFGYKGFDLNIQLTGSYGNKMVNATRIELETHYNPDNTTRSSYADAWTPTHTNTNVPSLGSETQYTYSSRWVEDASYLRIQNIALGYTLPSSVTNMLKISKWRLYISMQNVAILTKYSGYDPEVIWNPAGSTLASNVFRGMEYDTYPRTRNFTMGMNITF